MVLSMMVDSLWQKIYLKWVMVWEGGDCLRLKKKAIWSDDNPPSKLNSKSWQNSKSRHKKKSSWNSRKRNSKRACVRWLFFRQYQSLKLWKSESTSTTTQPWSSMRLQSWSRRVHKLKRLGTSWKICSPSYRERQKPCNQQTSTWSTLRIALCKTHSLAPSAERSSTTRQKNKPYKTVSSRWETMIRWRSVTRWNWWGSWPRSSSKTWWRPANWWRSFSKEVRCPSIDRIELYFSST